MRDLEETNCEIRSVVSFDLPQWELLDGPEYHDDVQSSPMTNDASKDTSSLLSGGFLGNDCKYSWLARNNHLVVIDTKTGKCICSWSFELKVSSVSTFPASSGQVPLLLIGLDNNALRIKDSIGFLCIFDCCTSNILTTIEVPAGVEKACVIHGGLEWEDFNDKRPDTLLPGNTGLIFAALRNLQHIVIDINRSIWKNFFIEGKTLKNSLEFVNITQSSHKKRRKEFTHLAYDLMDTEIEQFMGFNRVEFESTPLYEENLCSVLLSSEKTGCLITGCLGRVIVWQCDGSIGWISPLLDENAYVTHVALIEPSDDPRPFYYLWVACQSDSSKSSAVLRMYAMLFGKKRSSKNGSTSLYFDLESEPSLKFELELDEGERVHTVQPIERESLRDTSDITSRRGEDSLLLIGTSERSLIFDLNRWYKEQMPRTISECRNPNSVMASYRTRTDEVGNRNILACQYVPRSLKEFLSRGPTAMEELFYPNSLMIEWAEMGVDGIAWWLARGVQAELLREITIAGPIVLVTPSETYRRCLACGLIPFDSTLQDHPYRAEASHQREMLLSICLEQRWTNFLANCACEWSDGRAAYLYPEFIRWGVQRASELKLLADHLCVPLFDQSGTNIGESEARTLRFCEQQLECLTNVVGKLPNLENDLEKQRRALRRIATYLQVLMWFYDVGLLPEMQQLDIEEDEVPESELSMKIPYPKKKLVEWYKKKRASYLSEGDEENNNLFIDHLIAHECPPLKLQWERECGAESPNPGGGYYPPPSLQSLLRSFLTDCHREDPASQNSGDSVDNECALEADLIEMDNKHSVTIYLLMDLAMLLQGTYTSVDRLIKYPSAFKLSPSLIKLTQAFWLLDHDDYEGFFKIVTGQLISGNDLKEWHHKLAINTLMKNDQHKLALMYLRVLKPPLSSLEDQGTLISLTVGQGLVETAFHARPPSHYTQLLICFFQACKVNGKLKEVLQLALDSEEEEAFVKFLKDTGNEDARLFYYLQRGRHTEASDVFGLSTGIANANGQKTSVHPLSLKMLEAFNTTLPAITRQFATTLTKINVNSSKSNQDRGYPRPMSQCRDKTRDIHEVAYSKTRETCLKSDRSGPGHVPFLNAPISTLVYCSRVGNSSDMPETNNVVFAERKSKGKRTHQMMNNGEENESDRKRQRLDGTSKVRGDTASMRRLSMSQVCETPMIQRKLPQNISKSGGIAAETPHSILKIRQMFRHSNSPGFNNWSGSSDARLRGTPVDTRPARQIRFSMDRSRGSINESASIIETANREDNDKDDRASNVSVNSKVTEDGYCTTESFYSPNASNKSHRDNSILSDTSYTMFFQRPKARPSYRRSSITSQSPGNLSSKSTSSADTTIEAETTEIVKSKTQITSKKSKRKSILSSTIYNASILTPNTSIEESILKHRSEKEIVEHRREESEDDDEDDDEDIDERNDQEMIKNPIKYGLDKTSSANTSIDNVEYKDDDFNVKNSKIDQEIVDDEPMEIQYEEDEIESHNVSKAPKSQETEISEDENEPKSSQSNDVSTIENLQETEISEDEEDDYQPVLSQNTSIEIQSEEHEISEDDDNRKDQEEPQPVDDEQSFQSAGSNLSTMRPDYSNDQDYSITRPFKKIFEKNVPKDHNNDSHSFTKPIFMDEHGFVKYEEQLTEDSDVDVEQSSPNENADDGEITLNISNDSDSERQKNELVDEESGLGKSSTSSMVEKLSSNQAEKNKRMSSIVAGNVTKGTRSRHSSTSTLSTKSDDVYEDVPILRRSPRGRGSSSKESTPTKVDKNIEIDSKKAATPPRTSRAKTPDRTARLSKTPEHIARTSKTPERLARTSKTPERTITTSKTPERTVRASKTPERNTRNRSTSISKEDNKNAENTVSKIVIEPNIPELSDESTSPLKAITEPDSSPNVKQSFNERSKRNLKTQKAEEPVRVTRKTRAASLTQNTKTEQQINTTVSELKDDTKVNTTVERKISKSKQNKELDESKVQGKTRTTRGTRKDSAKQDIVEEKGVVTDDDGTDKESLQEQEVEEKPKKTRSTRASSQAKDTTIKSTSKKTRSASVSKDIEENHEVEQQPTTRRTRAASVAKSVIEDHKPSTPRKTRAASVTKDESAEKQTTKRATRASSVSKDASILDSSKRVTRQRGQSLPKDLPAILETSRISSRGRRSTSLLKEVILEESISQLDSPSIKRTRAPRLQTEDPLANSSSPAANTRRRRSSIQSIPEELLKEEPKKEIVEEPAQRLRRATSVDSAVVKKRTTRSKLSKASIIEEAIPEDAPLETTLVKKQRRKRETSVSNDTISEEKDGKKSGATRPKRGRKASESKDFEFSLPEETAAETPPATPSECHTPSFQFSEPTGLQKFLTPVRDEDEVSSDEKTSIRDINYDNDCQIRAQLRKPRTCFILPKRTKDKAK